MKPRTDLKWSSVVCDGSGKHVPHFIQRTCPRCGTTWQQLPYVNAECACRDNARAVSGTLRGSADNNVRQSQAHRYVKPAAGPRYRFADTPRASLGYRTRRPVVVALVVVTAFAMAAGSLAALLWLINS